ncbi:MAG TPA: septum formation initiator family protein [Longimicrobiales bacterium]|nr:septum formation initiator family protein [Longimicrobiales bacterium]
MKTRAANLVLRVLLAVAAYYATFGGEYSLFELWRTRAAAERERTELALLEQRLDSLTARADSLRNDPATLERIARERYGMIREGEILYRFAPPPDSVPPDSAEER